MTKRLLGFMKTNGAVILFFAVFLLYGLLTVKDYGISTDELIERESSLITYRYMVSSVADVVTETVNFPELTPLLEYKDRYYGMAVQIPAFVWISSGYPKSISDAAPVQFSDVLCGNDIFSQAVQETGSWKVDVPSGGVHIDFNPQDSGSCLL